MNIFKSIRVKVWLYISGFSACILILLWILQVGFLSGYYKWMKTNEIISTADKIVKSYGQIEFSEYSEYVKNLAVTQSMSIEIAYENGVSLKYDEMGSSSLTLNYSKKIPAYKQQILSSEKGMIIETLNDNYLKKETMLLGTYILTNPSVIADKANGVLNDVIEEPLENTALNNIQNKSVEAYVFIVSFLEPVGTTARILNQQFYLIIGIVMFIAFFISYFISNLIARPIVKINKAAKQLSKGNYEVNFEGDEYEEIRQLSETLNYASKEILRSDMLQKELIANISHDLRTPLTMIKAYAEMIRDLSGDNPEKRSKHVGVIIEEADRLTSLVADILNLSTIQSGASKLNLSFFNFSEHLKSLVTRYAIFREKNGYEFITEIQEDIYLNADITKIEQVLYNLINNAINYTGEDKKIIIRLYKKGNLVRFEVEDSGEGIAPEKLELIWDRYYKVGGEHKRAVVGTGLGLSIVKTILIMHNYYYGANSTVGQGTTFWFEAKPDDGIKLLENNK